MTTGIGDIKIVRRHNINQEYYDVVRLSIGGITFSADNSEHVERVIRRFAEQNNIEVVDQRKVK